MKSDYTTNSRYITHTIAFWKVGRIHFLSSGVKGLSPGQTVLPTQAKLWPNGATKSSQLERKPFNCLTTTAQSPNNNKTTWRELAWVGWVGQTVKILARVGRKFELDQIQAKWVAKRYPAPLKLWTWLESAWVGRTVWPDWGRFVMGHFIPYNWIPVAFTRTAQRNHFACFVM